jgi:hypothetical protein
LNFPREFSRKFPCRVSYFKENYFLPGPTSRLISGLQLHFIMLKRIFEEQKRKRKRKRKSKAKEKEKENPNSLLVLT